MAVTGTVREVVHVVRDRELPFMAAALAHYTLASLVPLLLLALSLAALFGSQEAIEAFVRNRLSDVLSGPGQRLVVNALTSIQGAVAGGLVSIVFALWSGSKIFRGLDVAFSELYETTDSPSLLEQLRDAVVVIGLLALTVAAMVATGVALSVLDPAIPYPRLVGAVVLFAALLAGLLPVYYVLTPVHPSLGDVLPGAALAAAGFVVLQVGFFYYARHASRYKTLGVLGAVLLFITWLYFGGIVVLLGGAVNYVTRFRR